MSLSRDLSQAIQPSNRILEFVYRHKKLKQIPDEIISLVHLQKLDLSFNMLWTLPEEIQYLSNLSYIRLANNQFTEFPKMLFYLSLLKFIDLKYNKLQSISPQIKHLQVLETLNLRANALHELPEELGKLPKLSKISLQQNTSLDLYQVTEVLSNLQNPFELDLSACQIYQLPNNFTKLQNLQRLNLSYNSDLDLEDAFEKLAHLPNLQSLSLEDTQENLPLNLTSLQNLQSLTYNPLNTDAKHIAQLKNLRQLTARKSSLVSIPEWLLEMPQLHILNLSDNKISQIPEEFSKLKNLKKVDFRNNSFTQIPPPLSRQLAQFEELFLDGNQNIPSKMLNKFLKTCNEQGLSHQQKEIACQLWNGQIPTQPWSLQMSLDFLKINIPILSKNTLAWTEQAQGNTTQDLFSFKTVALIGTSFRYTQKEAKKFLEENGLKLYSKSNKPSQPDAWILGERIKKEAVTDILAPSVVWTDSHLHTYLQKNKALPELPQSQIKKINTLLTQPNTQNQSLGLQMLQSYQLPIALREAICVIYLFHPDKKIEQLARNFVKKYFPNHLQAEMLKLKELDKEAALQALRKTDFLDQNRLVNTAYFIAEIAEKYVIEQGGVAFESLITQKINYRNILSLKLNIEDISSELKTQKHIQKIEIIGSVFHKIALKHIPEVLYEMPQLTYLRIDDAHLSEISPKITALQKLSKLRLANCKISKMPDTLDALAQLETLSLFNNKLKHIPQSIGKLHKLKELWLFSNQLQELPEEIGSLKSLERLHLSANQLKTLPKSIGQLVKLQELSISGNPLESLPEEMIQLKGLKRLEIRRNTLLSTKWRDWLRDNLPDCSIQFHY